MFASMNPPQVAIRLGQFIAASSWDAVPEAVRQEGKRSLLNFIGCALGVAHSPPIEMALRVLLPLSGPERVTLIGRRERLDPLSAAFLNAIGGNLLDYDDTHLRTVIHPTAPVAPVAFALGEQRMLPGQAILHAFILGAEVECRIGNAVSFGHYARGWHITSTCGVFGAAAACAKLLGLSADGIANAIGIAASQSAGIVENLPTAAKNVSVGNAARNGLFAALLAAEGYDASARAIEGPLGWARVMGDEPDLGRLVGGLGSSWEIAKNTYKPYPAGIVFHAVIDACFKLRTRLKQRIDTIESITVQGSALLRARGDRPVRGERDARVSIHHCAACTLLLGVSGVPEFAEPIVFRPDIVSLRGKIRAELDASLTDGAARVIIHLASGETLSETVMAARGSLADPLSDRDIEAKLRECARLGGTAWNADAIIEDVWHLDALADLSGLMNSHRGLAAAVTTARGKN